MLCFIFSRRCQIFHVLNTICLHKTAWITWTHAQTQILFMYARCEFVYDNPFDHIQTRRCQPPAAPRWTVRIAPLLLFSFSTSAWRRRLGRFHIFTLWSPLTYRSIFRNLQTPQRKTFSLTWSWTTCGDVTQRRIWISLKMKGWKKKKAPGSEVQVSGALEGPHKVFNHFYLCCICWSLGLFSYITTRSSGNKSKLKAEEY